MKRLNTKILGFCLIAFAIAGLATQVVYAWDWPDSDDLDDWWDDATDKAEDWWDDAEDCWDDKKEEAEDWWDDTKDNVEDCWDDATDKAEDWYSRAGEEWERFKEELENDLDSAIEMTRNAPYVSESWDLISQEMERQLCEDYNDPSKVSELERKRGLFTEVAIITIKMMPIYDPERRQIRTFSGFATDLVNESPALAGSDLAKDPVRCAGLLLLDSDYLLYAKIIKTNDGRWISIEEAGVLGYKTNQVDAARSECLQAKNAYANGDSELVETHVKNFCSKIQEINTNQNFDLLWLLSVGLIIGAAGMLVYSKKTKKEEIQ